MTPELSSAARASTSLEAHPPRSEPTALHGATAGTSEEFFHWLATWLLQEEGFTHAAVGELSGEDWDRVKTVAWHTPDGAQDNIEYDLEDTPCAHVVGRTPCTYSKNVTKEFPRDTILADLGIQSYVGVPLKDRAGVPLGLIVLFHTEPIDDARAVRATEAVSRFRPRAEEELEKRRALREYDALLEALATPRDGEVVNGLLSAMVRALRMSAGWVVRQVDDEAGVRMRSVASTLTPETGSVLEFDPADTPCATRADDEVQLWLRDIRRSFPSATFLHAQGAEGCLMASLCDAEQRRLGWVLLVHDRPVYEHVRTHRLLQTFLGLLGAELERADRALAERHMDMKLQETQRAEGLGLLAGGIAHDFNNLLAAILGHTELALEGVDEDSAPYARMRTVESAALQASQLCRQLLDYAGRRKPEVRDLDLGDIVQEMAGLLRASIPTSVEFRFRLADPGPVVRADPGQLRQVVMNLISNGVEAMASVGGVLEVRTGHRTLTDTSDTRDTHAELGLADSLLPGRYASLEVSDSGTGMAAGTRARIFDPFFTTKEGSHGLGLAVVTGILRRHGGAIEVDSTPGEGTSFRILLPLSDEPAIAGEPTEKRGTVLLADDQEMVLEVARLQLERAGFRVLSASDGREAVKLAQGYTGTLDCAVLDLAMPHLDGIDCLRALRTDRPNLPAVIVSGYLEHGLKDRVGPGELQRTVEKPFRGSTLVEAVLEAIGVGQEAE